MVCGICSPGTVLVIVNDFSWLVASAYVEPLVLV